MHTGMDILIMNNFVFLKELQPLPEENRRFIPATDAD
jgi:hypothetical protein